MSMKRVRIVNDGQPSFMTKVTNAETGEEIPHVTSIDIKLDVNDSVVLANITTIAPIVDVIADADVKQVCPCCGRPVEIEEK